MFRSIISQVPHSYGISFNQPLSELQTNSPNAPDSLVVVGIILGPHGVQGELRVRVLSEVPHRFNQGETLYVASQPLQILSSSRGRSDNLIIKLQGIDTPSAARELAGQELSCMADSAPDLPENEYFHYQLMGLQVITEEGEHLGRITEIIVTGSNDVYVVSGDKGDILLPALSQVVRQVNLEAGTMVVLLMDGLR